MHTFFLRFARTLGPQILTIFSQNYLRKHDFFVFQNLGPQKIAVRTAKKGMVRTHPQATAELTDLVDAIQHDVRDGAVVCAPVESTQKRC